MSRPSLRVRTARPDDVDDLMTLWQRTGTPLGDGPSVRDEAVLGLAQVEDAPDSLLLVGEAEHGVCASIFIDCAPLGPLQSQKIAHTSYLLVDPDLRGHGVAHQMMEAALSWAETNDINQITAITAQGSRETNRFLARLGLGAVATVRHTPTAVLRKKLGSRSTRRLRGQDRHLGAVIAQRRTMQRRSTV